MPKSKRRTAAQQGRRSTFWGADSLQTVLALCGLLIVLGAVVYANSFQVPFILDDKPHIVRDAAIRPPLSIGVLLTRDRPVVSLSLALNYAVGGLEVFGYHLMNIGAHVLCSLVMFGLARYTLRLPLLRERFGSAADILAFVAAAVFLVHPIQTESVTYVIQRAEVFAAIAIFGSLWIAAIATQRVADGHRPPWWMLAGLAALTAFGQFSKESVAVLPMLFALYDWCFLAAGRLRVLARHWPIYATLFLVAGAGVGLRLGQAAHHGELGGVAIAAPGAALPAAAPSIPADDSGDGRPLTPGRYMSWQFGTWLYYVRLILFPNRLCFDCGYLGPWPVRTSLLGDAVWPPALILVAIGLWAWHARVRSPLVTFCIWASAVALLPTSTVVPLTDAYVEHRLYVPIGFVAILAVVGVFSATGALVRRGWVRPRLARAGRIVAAVAALAALGCVTLARNAVYADPLRLWEDSVKKAPASERALFNLANEYRRRGQRQNAIASYQALIQLNPGPTYYINLGQQYVDLDRQQEAIDAFERARALAPTWGIAHRKLLVAYTRAGRLSDAVAAGERGTTLEPLYAPGYRLLADAYRRSGRGVEADKAYQTAATLDSWRRRPPADLVAPEGD